MKNTNQHDPQKPWMVVNTQSGRVVRRCNNYRGANRHAEMLNQRYGAVRYGVEQSLPPAEQPHQVERDDDESDDRNYYASVWEVK